MLQVFRRNANTRAGHGHYESKMTVLKPGEENNLELEYTGETKTVIIPAGAQIESLLARAAWMP